VANEAKVSLIIQIKNLAKRELDSFRQSLRNLGKEMKDLLSSKVTQALSLGAIAIGLRKAFQATDQLEQSQRLLAATSQLTGASLEELFGIANRLKDAFSLDDDQANKLTETITRLTVQAGRFNETQAAASAFLELGAARGFTITETLEALEGAYTGVYRGAQKLIGQNVEELFQAQARAIGVSVGELTQSEKAQTLLTAALQGGEAARGSFAAWLETAAGRQHVLNLRINDAQVAVGRALTPIRLLALQGFAFVVEKIREFVGGIQLMGAELGAFVANADARRLELVAWAKEFTASIVGELNQIPLIGRLIPDELAANLREGAARLRQSAGQLRAATREALDEARAEITGDFNAPPAGVVGGTGTGDIKPPVAPPDIRAVQAMQLEIEKLRIAYRDGQIGQDEFAEGLEKIQTNAREAAKAAVEGSDAWKGYQQIIDSTTGTLTEWQTALTELSDVTMQEFASVIEQSFAAMVDGSQKAGQAFQAAMLQAIAAVVRGLGQMMLVKVGENIAKAIEMPWASGQFLAAAAKYAGTAALAFAVAGSLGGAASSIGGSSGGGGAGGGGMGARSVDDVGGAIDRAAGNITIVGGLLDMNDERQANALVDALEDLTGRRVTINGITGGNA
jgi:hypothetical protein